MLPLCMSYVDPCHILISTWINPSPLVSNSWKTSLKSSIWSSVNPWSFAGMVAGCCNWWTVAVAAWWRLLGAHLGRVSLAGAGARCPGCGSWLLLAAGGTRTWVVRAGAVCTLHTRASNEPSRRFHNHGEGPSLGPSPGWKRLLGLSHLRHYAKL